MFWTCFGVLFPEISFCVVFHGGSSLRNGFKKSEILQNSKNAQNRSQKCQNLFLNMFWGNFSKNFFAQCSMVGRVYEMSLYKFKKFSKFQKRPKLFPNCPKVFWTCFGVIFSRNFFCPVFHVGSSLRNVSEKFSKFKKRPKPFPICPNVFWTCFGVILSKNFFAQCSTEGRVFEMFSKKNKKFPKLQKCPKSFPKVSKIVLNVFWGKFFENFFNQCSMEGRVFDMLLINQKIFKIP